MIVNEFMDMFQGDFWDCPDKDIEFIIDLVPRLTLVSKNTANIAPIMMKELNSLL